MRGGMLSLTLSDRVDDSSVAKLYIKQKWLQESCGPRLGRSCTFSLLSDGLGERRTEARVPGLSVEKRKGPEEPFLSADQVSRKLRNLRERLGCLSLRSAFASIWRMRSRVTENCCPTSSSV